MCDGTKQCADGSDESRCCEPGTLSNDKYQCAATGLCIPAKEVCDGWKHCVDGSDESFLACSLTRHAGGRTVITGAGTGTGGGGGGTGGDRSSFKGTMFFTLIFFVTVFSMLLVIVYRCAKRLVVSVRFCFFF